MILGVLTALAGAAVFGIAAVTQAAAVARVPTAQDLHLGMFIPLLKLRLFQVTLVLLSAGFVLHLVALRLLPLFLAQAVIGASVAVTALLAVRSLHAHLSRGDWLAIVAVVVGLGALGAAAGTTGTDPASETLKTALLPVILLIAVAAAVVLRRLTRHDGVVLGVLAGLAYAVVGIAARVLPSFSPAALVADPATYALLGAGLAALLLYSVALQRGSVTSVSAAVILMQTATPALVGLLLLGDTFRPGWGPVALVGFVASLAGCITLAHWEANPTLVEAEALPG